MENFFYSWFRFKWFLCHKYRTYSRI